LSQPSQRYPRYALLSSATAILQALALFLAGVYLLTFVIGAALRLPYPYELEWIEGANLRQALWIMEGHFPYRQPHVYFLPFAYTPFYFLLSAGAMKLLGVGFFAPRLISLLAAMGCCLLLYLLVQSETGSRPAGLLGAGLYAAAYRFTGAWMDLAKVDSLFLLLVLLAFWTGLRFTQPWGSMLSACLFVLAYYTKQLALPVILILAPLSLSITRGKTAWQWGLALGGGLALFFGLDRFSQGWFSFYTFTTVAHHQRLTDWWLFWRGFLPQTWPALLIAVPLIIQTARQTHFRHRQLPERPWLIIALAAGLFAASWSIYLKIYTWDNDRMPACLALALLAGMGFAAAPRLAATHTCRAEWFKLGALVMLICQFALFYYDPSKQIPSTKERQAAEAIIRRVRQLPGDVLVFHHGFVNYQAGKPSFLHSVPLGDVYAARLRRGTPAFERKRQVQAMFTRAIAQQRFDWVVIDKPETSWFPYYLYVEPFTEDNGAIYPVTGTSMIPHSLTMKNPVAHGGVFPLDEPLLERYFIHGWSQAGSEGRRLLGDSGALAIALERGHAYSLIVEVQPECPNGTPLANALRLTWNGELLGVVHLSACQAQTASFPIPTETLKKELNHLDFTLEGLSETASTTSTVRISRIEFVRQ